MIAVTVVGCGVMGKNHAHAVSDHPTLELESVVDLDTDRATAIAEEYGANRALTDQETAFADADAAIVATPESAHAAGAHAALDHGCHLLLEKPITAELGAAWELADRAEGTDLTTGAGFILRYDPAYSGVREVLDSGDLGEPVSVRAKRAVRIDESRRAGAHGHPIDYLNIHDIDAMEWVLGSEVTRVRANERRGRLADLDIPDAVHAIYEFENGVTGVLEGYGTLPSDTPGGIEAALDVVGTDGQASVDIPGTTLTVHADHFDRPDTHHWPVVNGQRRGAVRNQIDWFASAIESGEDMLATITDGARAQAIAAATRSAAETGAARSIDRN